jgi:hypothetical protein
MRAVLAYVFKKCCGVKSFSNQAAKVIGKGDDHGPNLVAPNQAFQLIHSQHPG